ncbi:MULTISPECIES: hypothetical protein [Paenibacillus]|nr:hypothetical protein [Paenibacillus odorifer]
MSDSGKVSLPSMTPERFKKIKKVFGQVGLLTGTMAAELLAALEES